MPQDDVYDDADVSHRDRAVSVGIGTVRRIAGVVQLQDLVHHHGDVRHRDVSVAVGVAPQAQVNVVIIFFSNLEI